MWTVPLTQLPLSPQFYPLFPLASKTHSPVHPSPFLRNFSPGQRKGRFCSFQS